MTGLEPHIVQQLRGFLPADWTVKGASEPGDRKARPLASVAIGPGSPGKPGSSAVMVAVGWRITLLVTKSDQASAQMDEAIAATLRALLDWAPGVVAGRAWERLELASVLPPDVPAEDGLVAFELGFQTAAKFNGNPDSY